jgi:D-arabinose 1-dehydrogenase-like Zn-dependent alcohol dehydrogenase
MKAVLLREAGDASVLRCEAVADPRPARGEVLVRVAAAGVCAHDVAIRNGTLKRGISFPSIPGHELAGIVEAVGEDVEEFRVGDRVASTQRKHVCGTCDYCRTGQEAACPKRVFLGHGQDAGGGYAERVCVGHENLAHVPESVELTEAAVAACTFGTCLNAVRDVARLSLGETVLVTGAGGGLGIHALQVARLAGARVLALTTSAAKAPRLSQCGAHQVILAERGEDFSAKVRAATGGRGVDVLIDNVGSAIFHPNRRSLAPGGRWVLVGELAGGFVQVNPAQIFLQGLSILSVRSATRLHLRQVLGMMGDGRLKAVIEEDMPLRLAAEAHRRVEAGQVTGRLILRP